MNLRFIVALLAASQASVAFSQTWSDQPRLSTPRESHSATLLGDGRVLVIGGELSNAALKTAEIFDPALNTWTRAADMADPRSRHTATRVPDGRVVVVGGQSGGVFSPLVEIYDPLTDTWAQGAGMRDARGAHTATLLPNGRIFVVAGQTNNSGYLDRTALYDPVNDRWEQTASITPGRAVHSATLLADGRVFVACGFNPSYLDSSTIYDPAADAWTPITPPPDARHSHTTTLLRSGEILLAAGEGPNGPLGSAALYEFVFGTWKTIAPLGPGRVGATATMLPSGRVLIAGGQQGIDVRLFNPGSESFADLSPMTTNRFRHTATLLPGGRVLVVGGSDGTSAVDTVEVYDPASPSWSGAGAMPNARSNHTATLLPSGALIVVGGEGAGVDLPRTASWNGSSFGSVATMTSPRSRHTATLLPDQTLLATGGRSGATILAAVERYDAVTDRWSPAARMAEGRHSHTATLMRGGRLVVAGGAGGSRARSTVESYSSGRDEWTQLAAMSSARMRHTASLLPNGHLLVAGGRDGATRSPLVEAYDPELDTWTPRAALNTPRDGHVAILLADDRILILGGSTETAILADGEIYDPAADAWTPISPMDEARADLVAVPLLGGQILVIGGRNTSGALNTAELYSLGTDSWQPGTSFGTARYGHTVTVLPDGRIVIVGGTDTAGAALIDAEIYDEGRTTAPAGVTPTLALPAAAAPGDRLQLTGTRLVAATEGTGGGFQSSPASHPLVRIGQTPDATGRYLPVVGFTPTSLTVQVPLNLTPRWLWIQPVVSGIVGDAVPIRIARFDVDPGTEVIPDPGAVDACARGGEFAVLRLTPMDLVGLPLPPGRIIEVVENAPYVVAGAVTSTTDTNGVTSYAVEVGSDRCGALVDVTLTVDGTALAPVSLEFTCPAVDPTRVWVVRDRAVVPVDDPVGALVTVTARDRCNNPAFGRSVELVVVDPDLAAGATVDPAPTVLHDDLGSPLDGAAIFGVRSVLVGSTAVTVSVAGAVVTKPDDFLSFSLGDTVDVDYRTEAVEGIVGQQIELVATMTSRYDETLTGLILEPRHFGLRMVSVQGAEDLGDGQYGVPDLAVGNTAVVVLTAVVRMGHPTVGGTYELTYWTADSSTSGASESPRVEIAAQGRPSLQGCECNSGGRTPGTGSMLVALGLFVLLAGRRRR